MATQYCPALSEEPQNQSTQVIPPIARESLLGWLESSGKFKAEDINEAVDDKIKADLDYILEALEDDEELLDSEE